MLTSKLIHRVAEFEKYQASFGNLTNGVKIPNNYLEQSIVRVFYHESINNEWVGGYIINTSPDFRYLSFIPVDQCDQLLQMHHIHQGNIAEITGIWLHSKKCSFWERIYYYLLMVRDTLSTQKEVVLGGAIVKKIQDFQMQLMSHVLYNGPVWLIDRSANIKIYYAKRSELVPKILNWLYKTIIKGFIKTR